MCSRCDNWTEAEIDAGARREPERHSWITAPIAEALNLQ
jgi:hypothetical protein